MQTCGRCHTQVSANFIQYDPHPEPKDPNKSLLVYYVAGFMQWLLIGVFGFFGLHTLLWLQRSIVSVMRSVVSACSASSTSTSAVWCLAT